jgi:hypothetical protein
MDRELLMVLYFVPSVVALYRETPNKGSTIVVNIFLGWTVIGWVVALAMAFGRTEKTFSRPASNPNLPPLPQRLGTTFQTESGFDSIHKRLKPPATRKGKLVLVSSVLALLVSVSIFSYVYYFNAGPRFTYNVNGEGLFGNSTHPEGDDISYVKVKKLVDPSGVESYYFVMKVTNYSSETSSYSINVALVCDGFKKFQTGFNISRLAPSETRSKEQQIKNELKVNRCTATVDVSRDAS